MHYTDLYCQLSLYVFAATCKFIRYQLHHMPSLRT